jgi:hypothetical protein
MYGFSPCCPTVDFVERWDPRRTQSHVAFDFYERQTGRRSEFHDAVVSNLAASPSKLIGEQTHNATTGYEAQHCLVQTVYVALPLRYKMSKQIYLQCALHGSEQKRQQEDLNL